MSQSASQRRRPHFVCEPAYHGDVQCLRKPSEQVNAVFIFTRTKVLWMQIEPNELLFCQFLRLLHRSCIRGYVFAYLNAPDLVHRSILHPFPQVGLEISAPSQTITKSPIQHLHVLCWEESFFTSIDAKIPLLVDLLDLSDLCPFWK